MFMIKVITPETNHPKEGGILSALVSIYNCTIHIRKPRFTADQYKKYLHDHNQLLSHFVLHEHHSLAKEFPVMGVHLKELDRINPAQVHPDIKIISTSIHSIADAGNLSHPFEYIFYSPLFQSISKENYGTNNSLADLKKTVSELKEQTGIPIIGLGGIYEANIDLVKKSGFDGAALLGAVWVQSDPLAAFGRIASMI
ncbi:thiamine-phosphate diphosphorylase [Cytophaga hutchinsonii ATCC 33406]|uniref:Thiamine-phosphate diphosphorylase n=2 Tax=Cytophaga hutchinsonii TaxID=985 RepID=A0A6N4SMN4_CYTH3|nr:thiamine-phosphate diphosphorylase [Cytophaga hutchinsonii ATCC 33406]SFW99479.1 thiamine-phosphate diphosphorylase [Cytophaga hutchinsonii ATCC 33406]